MPCVAYDAGPARPSSWPLQEAVHTGVRALGGEVRDLGEVTTPQLHFITWQTNIEPALATEAHYFAQLATAFAGVVGDRRAASPLNVDAANGVGAPKLAELAPQIANILPLRVVNDGKQGGALNFKVWYGLPLCGYRCLSDEAISLES